MCCPASTPGTTVSFSSGEPWALFGVLVARVLGEDMPLPLLLTLPHRIVWLIWSDAVFAFCWLHSWVAERVRVRPWRGTVERRIPARPPFAGFHVAACRAVGCGSRYGYLRYYVTMDDGSLEKRRVNAKTFVQAMTEITASDLVLWVYDRSEEPAHSSRVPREDADEDGDLVSDSEFTPPDALSAHRGKKPGGKCLVCLYRCLCDAALPPCAKLSFPCCCCLSPAMLHGSVADGSASASMATPLL
jgi:hypothetical protein